MARQLCEAALASKQIKKALKVAFPTTKFSVISDNYSMGDSINVNWTDGPTTKQVEEYTNQHKDGHFDGMIDLYEYRDNPENIPRTKYLFTNREMSENVMHNLIAAHNASFCEENQIPVDDLNVYLPWASCYTREYLWREFREVSLK